MLELGVQFHMCPGNQEVNRTCALGRQTRVRIPALPLNLRCAGGLISDAQLSHLQKGSENLYSSALLGGLNMPMSLDSF